MRTAAAAGERLALAAYSAGLGLLAPLAIPILALHPRLRGGLAERLGQVPRARAGSSPVWLHGASAGDLQALLPLAGRLRAAGLEVALSAGTRAGHALALRRGAQGPLFRAPLDLGFAVRAALARLRPRLLVLEALELWPRLWRSCVALAIPIVVVNGRLSSRSLARYRLAPWLFRRCFAGLSRVWASSGADADRFVQAGVPRDRVVVEGSSKHGELPPLAPPSPRARVVLGSVHREELRALLPALAALRRERRALELVVAPRYLEEVGPVLRVLGRAGLTAVRSSQATGAPGVEVIDEMGVLADRYRGATLAFVGGSLVPVGGHNLIEPAARGVPVLFGPHTAHCASEASALGASGGGALVADAGAFAVRALQLLADPAARAAASVAARSCAERLAGAADRIADGLRALVERRC